LNTRLTLAAVPAIAGTLLLAGCAGGTPDHGSMPGMDMPSSSAAGAPTSGPHNAADVMFATMMIPHHAQAIQMSDILLAKPDADPRVRSLARQIKAAQTPEITKMNGFLSSWGTPTVAPTPMAMSGMGDGMMSSADMDRLEQAGGATASKLFLQQMVSHHTGAIGMAKTELSGGTNPAARSLAEQIISAQQKEIDLMKLLRTQL
jgi:uncharacterized protein (DUF305 family)